MPASIRPRARVRRCLRARILHRSACELRARYSPRSAPQSRASRAGVMRTNAVETRTTLLLARFRYHLTTNHGEKSWQTLQRTLASLRIKALLEAATWLESEATAALLSALKQQCRSRTGSPVPPTLRGRHSRAHAALRTNRTEARRSCFSTPTAVCAKRPARKDSATKCKPYSQ